MISKISSSATTGHGDEARRRSSAPVSGRRADAPHPVGAVILALAALLIVIPLAWALLSSFRSNSDFVSQSAFFPKSWTASNYVTVFTEVPMARFLVNSILIASLASAGAVLASATAAFCLARLDFPGRRAIFIATVLTMLIPTTVTLIPYYIIIRELGLIDTPWALILPNWTGNALTVFFLRQHMLSVPRDFFEAATLDGASAPQILFRIYLPMLRGPLAVLIVLNFMFFWNDLLGPLIYLNTPDQMTATAGLAYFQGQYVSNFPVVLAGAVISIIPTTIVFLLFSRQIRDGLLLSGIK